MTKTVTGICWGLTSYGCPWNSPKHVPSLCHWFLSSTTLNLIQDNCPLSTLAVSDFLLLSKKLFWRSCYIFSTDGVSHSILLSHFSDPLATEESKRGPAINDMIGKLSAERTLIFLYPVLSNPYYENNNMLVSLAFICCLRNMPIWDQS